MFKDLLKVMMKQEGYENDNKFCWSKAVQEKEFGKLSKE
jgi:hypothetical protein